LQQTRIHGDRGRTERSPFPAASASHRNRLPSTIAKANIVYIYDFLKLSPYSRQFFDFARPPSKVSESTSESLYICILKIVRVSLNLILWLFFRYLISCRLCAKIKNCDAHLVRIKSFELDCRSKPGSHDVRF